jgi:hypothetical protein
MSVMMSRQAPVSQFGSERSKAAARPSLSPAPLSPDVKGFALHVPGAGVPSKGLWNLSEP